MAKHMEYFKDCTGMDKKESIEHVINTFGLKRNTAATYYALWQSSVKKEEEKKERERRLELLGIEVADAPIVSYNINEVAQEPNLDKGWVPVQKHEPEPEKESFVVIAKDADPENDMVIECENAAEMIAYANNAEDQGYEVTTKIITKDSTYEEVKEKLEKPRLGRFFPVIMRGDAYEYSLSNEGLKIVSEASELVTREMLDELSEAMDVWEKYYLN